RLPDDSRHDSALCGPRRVAEPDRGRGLRLPRSAGEALVRPRTAPLAEDIEWESPQQIGLWTDAWMRFRRNRLAVGSLAFVLLLITLAVIAPLLEHFGLLQDPTAQDVVNNYAGPGAAHHILGTDDLGRDVLSKVIFGSQVSLSIGILVQAIVLVIGGSIGLAAGYF